MLSHIAFTTYFQHVQVYLLLLRTFQSLSQIYKFLLHSFMCYLIYVAHISYFEFPGYGDVFWYFIPRRWPARFDALQGFLSNCVSTCILIGVCMTSFHVV
jgi:hypothetical protein